MRGLFLTPIFNTKRKEIDMNESKLRSSVTLRMFVMAMVVLFLLILAATIRSLISERQQRRDEAVNEVSQKWGNAQTITGPVLTIPFRKPTKDQKGKTVSNPMWIPS